MTKNKMEVATLGGGCFWCLEAIYQQLKGVRNVRSGYAGGHVQNPSYREVCAGTTGHAEVCRIEFDPDVISFDELLGVFWTIHNPTTLNRQGKDVGPQYRSVIFYHNEEQKNIAVQSILNVASDLWSSEIVTEVTPLSNYSDAEEDHKDYYNQNGQNPYCAIVISPKIAKFRTRFQSKLKGNPSDN